MHFPSYFTLDLKYMLIQGLHRMMYPMDPNLGRVSSDGKKMEFRNILLQTKQSPSPQTHTFALLRLIFEDHVV